MSLVPRPTGLAGAKKVVSATSIYNTRSFYHLVLLYWALAITVNIVNKVNIFMRTKIQLYQLFVWNAKIM
jgi:hypothetical protein